MDKLKWFEDGLRFKCTGCGNCCTGSDGYVFLAPSDIENLVKHLKIPKEEFLKKYTRQVQDKIALIDRPGSGDCIFLQDNKCNAYDARPVQCQTFPWWLHNLETIQDWEEAAKNCEGINHADAPLIASMHIKKECLTYLDNLLEQNF